MIVHYIEYQFNEQNIYLNKRKIHMINIAITRVEIKLMIFCIMDVKLKMCLLPLQILKPYMNINRQCFFIQNV